MAPTTPSRRDIPTPIPTFYAIFFLYLDPLICLSGIHLSFFDQSTFLMNGVPSSLKVQHENAIPNHDLTSHFIRSLGAYSVAIFILQILLGWGFKDAKDGLNVRICKSPFFSDYLVSQLHVIEFGLMNTGRILQFSILTIDVLLLYSIYLASPGQFLNLKTWDSGDWTNNGILSLVAIIRSAFLLGIGM